MGGAFRSDPAVNLFGVGGVEVGFRFVQLLSAFCVCPR